MMAGSGITKERVGVRSELVAQVSSLVHADPFAREVVLIVPTQGAVRSWRRILAAQSRSGGFGVDVTTFEHHIQDMWAIAGDGRQLVNPTRRISYIAQALAAARESGVVTRMRETLGTARVLGEVIEEGAHHEGFWERVADAVAAESSIREPLTVITAYRKLLEQHHMVERGEALLAIAAEPLAPADVILLDPHHLRPAEVAYLESAGAHMLEFDPAGDSVAGGVPALVAALYGTLEPLEPTSSVRFISATGVEAEPNAIVASVFSALADGERPEDIFVACADPIAVFDRVAPLLAERGISASGPVGGPAASTPLGSVYLGLLAIIEATVADVRMDRRRAIATLTGYAQSPFCSIAPHEAEKLDALMRFDRRLPLDHHLQELRKLGEEVATVLDALIAGDHDTALATLSDTAIASGRLDDRARALALQTVSKLSGVHTDARVVGLSDHITTQMLESVFVSITATSIPPDPDPDRTGAVRFGTLDDLASQGASAAVITQLSADGFALRSTGDPAGTLLADIGITRNDTRLVDLRASFKNALDAVSHTAIFTRALHDSAGDPQNPSILFEEVVDTFRSDRTDPDELDRTTALPHHLLIAEVNGHRIHEEVGEKDLISLFPTPFGSSQAGVDDRPLIPAPAEQQGSERLAPELISRLMMRDGEVRPLSPSAVESYASCPYRWFIERRIAASALDTANDQLAFGSFVHAVLERFHSEWTAAGNARVTTKNLETAYDVLDEVFDAVRDDPTSRPGELPVITSKLDEQQLETWRTRLRAFLRTQTSFLPGFSPRTAEASFGGTEQERVMYAGYPFRGCIDRIDSGQLASGEQVSVVIDYKGSLSKKYSPDIKEGVIPQRIQAMVYAGIAEQLLGERVIASLFLSYKNGKTEGVYDPSAIGPESMPSMRTLEGLTQEKYRELLTQVECDVAESIAAMYDGKVEREPKFGADSCSWCPVIGCEKRVGS